jgi:hypothetical protein
VEVSTENGSAADVSLALTADPSSLKPTFTSGCGTDDGTAKCAVNAVADGKTISYGAQIPVASGASAVTAAKLTATASITTAATWTAPAATEIVSVGAATKPTAPATPSKPASVAPIDNNVTLGPAPGDLSSQTGQLVGASNASGLFPAIVPSTTPSPSPGAGAGATPGATRPVADSSALALGKPVLTAQVAGLAALGMGILLTVTRLSLRKRFRSRKQGS